MTRCLHDMVHFIFCLVGGGGGAVVDWWSCGGAGDLDSMLGSEFMSSASEIIGK